MTSLYKEMTERHQNEYNEFSKGKIIYIFAFSDEDFNNQLAEKGLTVKDISSIGGGAFLIKNKASEIKEFFKRQKEELKAAIKADTTGKGFIKDMFYYELADHEYLYTYDVEYSLSDICHSLQITMQDIYDNKTLSRGLKLAIKELKSYED